MPTRRSPALMARRHSVQLGARDTIRCTLALSQERPGQIVHREARTGEKRGTLAEAPPGFRRTRPRKDFGLDDLGQNLETLNDPWTRAIEVRGAVHRVDRPSRTALRRRHSTGKS